MFGMPGTWEYSSLVELDGPQARDPAPQLAAQLWTCRSWTFQLCGSSMLLRFRDGGWQEQGRGGAKLLLHRRTGKVWFGMRQEKTMTVVSKFDVADDLSFDVCSCW